MQPNGRAREAVEPRVDGAVTTFSQFSNNYVPIIRTINFALTYLSAGSYLTALKRIGTAFIRL